MASRLDRKSVANLLGTWAWTYSLWEKNRAEPKIWNMRKVVEFLGLCPIDPDDTPAGVSPGRASASGSVRSNWRG